MIFRLIILGLLIYLAVKLFEKLLHSTNQKSEIKGTPITKKPLDLSNADIEDADFEEINEK